MSLKRLYLFLAFGLISGVSQAAQGLIGGTGVTTGTTLTEVSASWNYLPGQGIRVQLPQRFSAFGLNLNGADWSQYSHVLVTLTNNQPKPVAVQLVIDSGTSGWAWSDFVIGASATETLAVPLSNAQTMSWSAWPSIDGTTAQATSFGNVVKGNIKRIRLWNMQRQGSQDLTIGQMTAVSYAARTTSLIDQYGQQTISFANKVTADSQLTAQATADASLSGQFPYGEDAYGGVAGSGMDSGNGRWRTAKQNGKWYIIDPAGNRFFSTGIVSVGTGTIAYTQNRSSLFSPGALPSQSGQFADHWSNGINPGTGNSEPGFNFYTANLERKYGINWHTPAFNNIVRRMRTWGFNTVGPASKVELYNQSYQFANMQQTSITGNFKHVTCPGSYQQMPDVYDPAWSTAVGTSLAPVVANLNLSSYNVGLFVDNELPWAFDWAQTNYRYDLAFNVLASPSNQPAKQRFYATLLMTYRTIQKLNASWGSSFASWNAFLSTTNYRPNTIRPGLAKDMQAFLTAYASQYFSVIKNKLTALNYKGLYLGCRLFYYSPETVAAAARYCDVISFNAYDLTPSQWRTDLKTVDRPVMVSEFGMSAMDFGRVGGGYPNLVAEADRAEAYTHYVIDAMSWPNMVGLHWYKWDDDPVTGRMWDNGNQCLGLVSIADTPYQPMVDAATDMNTSLNNRLLNP